MSMLWLRCLCPSACRRAQSWRARGCCRWAELRSRHTRARSCRGRQRLLGTERVTERWLKMPALQSTAMTGGRDCGGVGEGCTVRSKRRGGGEQTGIGLPRTTKYSPLATGLAGCCTQQNRRPTSAADLHDVSKHRRQQPRWQQQQQQQQKRRRQQPRWQRGHRWSSEQGTRRHAAWAESHSWPLWSWKPSSPPRSRQWRAERRRAT